MKITILLENTTKDERLLCNHGSGSAYIEANGKKILLDTGQDDNFIYNAELLGVDLKAVNFAVISHFHYDHAGGLKTFLKINKTAKVYIGREAFADYYVEKNGDIIFFGLDSSDYDIGRFIFVDESIEAGKGINIISKLGYTFDNLLNEAFLKKVDGEYIKDDFSHEIAIVIDEGEKSVLLSGCFHSGVVNSVKRAAELGHGITDVLGGFHLSGSGGRSVSDEYFAELVEFFTRHKLSGYTGHCTGQGFLDEMIKRLPDLIKPLCTGAEYTI